MIYPLPIQYSANISRYGKGRFSKAEFVAEG
jgi:hypothetical protein